MKIIKFYLVVVFVLSQIFLRHAALASETTIFPQTPSLQIVGLSSQNLHYLPPQLNSFKEAKVIEIKFDPAFHKTMRYKAVPFKSLLGGYAINKDATIEFECLDGYNAVLDADELLNAGEINQAYVAYSLENGSPIPRNQEQKEIGPFYLVWPSPKNGVFKETNWPFNLKAFKIINKSFKEQFPGLYPQKLEAKSVSSALINDINEGLEAFRLNCFVCHSMNGSGRASMGIDLKLSSLVEIKTDQELAAFVRDPNTLMPGIKMSAFTRKMLSDEDLTKIIRYLKYMKAEGRSGL